MMVEMATEPSTLILSPGLWQIWFDRGMAALESNDLRNAKIWLTEALRHVCCGGPDDQKQAVTVANLAFAHLREAQHLCWRAHSPCIRDCEREKLQEQAQADLHLSQQKAVDAAPRLCMDDNPQNKLARARAFHVLGEGCRLVDQYSKAAQNFIVARDCYADLSTQVLPLEEMHSRLFEAYFYLGCFKDSLDALTKLETLVSAQSDPKSLEWLARLAAARASTLLEMGRYRDAAAHYDRWFSLVKQMGDQPFDHHDRAVEIVTFARTQLVMGNYDVVAMLIEWCDRLMCCMPVHNDWLRACLTTRYCCCPSRDDSLRFNLALLKAELALALGDLACASHLMKFAAEKEILWSDCHIRLALARGQLAFELGLFLHAYKCFTVAKQLAETTLPCRRALLVSALRGLARTESESTSWMAAIEHICQAIRCLETNGETITAEFAWLLQELANIYIQNDSAGEALPLCERARDLLNMTLRPGHPANASLELTFSESRLSLRKPHAAIEACQNANQIYREFESQEKFAYARTLRLEAEAFQCKHQPDCAQQLLECALKCWTTEEVMLNCVHPEGALIEIDLAVNKVTYARTMKNILLAESTRNLLVTLRGNKARAGFEMNRRGRIMMSYHLFIEAEWLFCQAIMFYNECYGPTHPFTVQACQNLETACRRQQEACVPFVTECPECG